MKSTYLASFAIGALVAILLLNVFAVVALRDPPGAEYYAATLLLVA
ncbi:MAG: hypothetical protein GY953_40490, partial [bacterium]|nr:hypothetical protein [bacterium]